MNLYALVGATETGLAFALVALGAYLTFRVLDSPTSPPKARSRSAPPCVRG